MTLITLRQLDQKNRLHIPELYMKLAGIENNSTVTIELDSTLGRLIIRPLSENEKQALEKLEK